MRRALWVLALLPLLAAGCRPNPVWSPDGKLLALEPRGQLFTFNTQTKQFRQLTRGPRAVVGPAWAPSGRQIAYYSLTRKGQETTAIDLLSADVTTGVSRPLVSKLPLLKPAGNALDLGAPIELLRESLAIAWKPDGTQFAYLAFEGTDTTLWVANADGTAARSLLTSNRSAYSPVWSPDGSRIAFISLTPMDPNAAPPANAEALQGGSPGTGNLEVVNADGSDRKMLWDGRAREALSPFAPPPVWSADGKSLYVTVDREKKDKQPFPEKCELFAVSVDGSEPKSMGMIGGPSPFMSLNPAGAIFFLAPATENEKYPRIGFSAPPFASTELLGTLDAKALGTPPTPGSIETDNFPVPSISPDGSRFALTFVPKTGRPSLLLRSTAADGKWERYPVPLASATPARPAAKKPARKPVRRRR